MRALWISMLLLTAASGGCGKNDSPTPPASPAAKAEIEAVDLASEPNDGFSPESPVITAEGCIGVDEPMPPIDEGAPPRVIAHGSLSPIDLAQKISGEVSLYEDADGMKLLRIENLQAPPQTKMQFALAKPSAPKTSADLEGMLSLGELKDSCGNMNYLISRDTNIAGLHSLVLAGQESPVPLAFLTLK